MACLNKGARRSKRERGAGAGGAESKKQVGPTHFYPAREVP